MAPNLELVYDSYQRNGWLGVGWSLDMGSIQINTNKGPDASYFIFTKNGSTTELVSVGGGEYRAKIEDGSFLRFFYKGRAEYLEQPDHSSRSRQQELSARQPLKGWAG